MGKGTFGDGLWRPRAGGRSRRRRVWRNSGDERGKTSEVVEGKKTWVRGKLTVGIRRRVSVSFGRVGAPTMRGIRQVIGIRQVSNPHRIHCRERRVDDGWQCAKMRGNGADSRRTGVARREFGALDSGRVTMVTNEAGRGIGKAGEGGVPGR